MLVADKQGFYQGVQIRGKSTKFGGINKGF